MRLSRIGLSLVFVACIAAAWQGSAPPLPASPKQPVVDEYHGVKVTDDYRWLEDGKDPKVTAWTQAEDAHARAMLDPLPLHDSIQQYFKKLASERSPSYYDLETRGGVIFAMNSTPGKQQDILVTLRSPDDPASAHVVVDPGVLDATNSTSIEFYVPSLDGSKVAVCLPKGGSEMGDAHIFDVATGRALSDVVPRVLAAGGGSVAWNADATGFYYTRYPQEGERAPEDMNFYEQVYFHKLGTPLSDDTYVIGKDFPRIGEITLNDSKDGRYLLVQVENGDGGQYEYFLRDAAGKWTQLSQFADQIIAVAFGDDALYALSRDHAPRGKLLRSSLSAPYLKNAKTIIPETTRVIQDFRFTLAGFQPSFLVTPHRLYVTELDGGPSEIHIFDHNGKSLGTVPAERVSTITQVSPLEGDRILFGNMSYVDPFAWFTYDPATRKTTITALKETSPISFADVQVDRESAVSKDGTKVPLNIMRLKSTKLDGRNPTILTGYGGFGLSQTPFFDIGVHSLLEAGGVLAIANLRGGGEFGEDWHKNGSGIHKQNVFDDFIACAERLIQAGYTNPSKFAIEGGSNGGLLMGAALTQRPELFRAVVSFAGLYDMLRSETTMNGQFNATEYGSVKDADQFKALYAYSPYHHVKDGVKYPAILFIVGENDPRVDPWHSRKFTARLQAATASGLPVSLISFSNAGHGGIGSAEDQRIAMGTYALEFEYQQLGVKWVTPKAGGK